MGTAPSPVPLPLEFGLGLSSLPPNPLLKVRLANLSGSVPPFSPNSPSITTTTMYFAATFVASLLLSANALVTPHAGDNLYRRHQHAGLARRAIAPEHPAQPMEASAAIPKRQLKKRCKPRRTSSGTLSATSSAAPLPSGKPANVAAPVPSPTTNHDTPSSSSPSPSPKPSPSPSSSPAPAPKPSPTSSAAPAPSSGSSGGQSSSLFTGQQDGAQGTFYAPGLGACGITNSGGDFIAAVSEDLFDHYPGYNGVNPNQNPVCNKKVTATYQGKSVTVTVTDRCTGCAPKDLDFSPTAFSELADQSVGRLFGMTWTWDD